jgi:hypothetical protein
VEFHNYVYLALYKGEIPVNNVRDVGSAASASRGIAPISTPVHLLTAEQNWPWLIRTAAMPLLIIVGVYRETLIGLSPSSRSR